MIYTDGKLIQKIQIPDYLSEKPNDNIIKVLKKLDIGKPTIYRYLKEMLRTGDH